MLCWKEDIWGTVARGGDALKSIPYPHKGQDTLSALSKRKIIYFVFRARGTFSPPAYINTPQHLQHPAALSPGSPWVHPQCASGTRPCRSAVLALVNPALLEPSPSLQPSDTAQAFSFLAIRVTFPHFSCSVWEMWVQNMNIFQINHGFIHNTMAVISSIQENILTILGFFFQNQPPLKNTLSAYLGPS